MRLGAPGAIPRAARPLPRAPAPGGGEAAPGRAGKGPSGLLTPLLAGFALLACGGSEGEITPPTPAYGALEVTYPMLLWEQEVEGRTLLRVLVTREGEVAAVEIAESSGEAQFDTAAVRAIRNARFRPARQGERPVEVWATLPVVFSKTPRQP